MFSDIEYKLLVKPILEAYPHAIDIEGNFTRCYDYLPMIVSMGFDFIIINNNDDYYSGDSRYLLKHGFFYGILICGWGSCSGCDALQACQSIEELESLRKELFDSIKWGTRTEILTYIEEHDWEGDFSANQKNMKLFLEHAKQYLSKSY